jgi:hypothetical protein
MADIEFERKQAAYHRKLPAFWSRLAKLARRLFRQRPPRLYREELSPHLARDLGLVDAVEKPILSTGIIDTAPRV